MKRIGLCYILIVNNPEMVDFIDQLQNAVSEDINPEKMGESNDFFDKLYGRLENELELKKYLEFLDCNFR